MKYILATWVGTNPGGGVSIQNFKEYRQTVIQMPNGSTQLRREKVPMGITVMPSRDTMSSKDDPVEFGDEKFWFKKGEFAVQDIPENMEILREYTQKGRVRVNDWDLHEKLLEIELPPQHTEVVVDNEPEVIDITAPKSKAAKDKKKKEALDKLRPK